MLTGTRTATWRRLEDRLREVTREATDLPTLAAAVCAAVEAHVPYDFGCFAATDPATGLITWTHKTRPLGEGDGDFAAAEHGPPDINSFAEIACRRPPSAALWLDTGGAPDTCRRHRDYMRPRFGFGDELRVAFVSRGATWGVLAIYRGACDPPFSGAEVAQLGAVSELVAEAVQRSLFRHVPTRRPGDEQAPTQADGPAVLIVDAADRVTHITPAARAAVDELGGWDHGELPAPVLHAVASTRTGSAPVTTRVRGSSGGWSSLRTAALAGPSGETDVVVTVEATPRAVLSRLALAAHGLTAREEDVALLVLQGADTRAIASALHLSPYTVQDHLKVVFSKCGVTSRRELTARLVLH